MAHHSQLARIIDQSPPPDYRLLGAIAREVFRRARGIIVASTPRAEADADADDPVGLQSLTLGELCRRAIQAIPDRRKI